MTWPRPPPSDCWPQNWPKLPPQAQIDWPDWHHSHRWGGHWLDWPKLASYSQMGWADWPKPALHEQMGRPDWPKLALQAQIGGQTALVDWLMKVPVKTEPVCRHCIRFVLLLS
jgi:hypothetical protein